MPSTEVQRTLVKSPPELWAELSDPASLARHLGELGEIQVTRVEPESEVEWEAASVKGSVQLKASGWGTKVTFSITREPPEQATAEPEPVGAEPEPAAAESEPVAIEPEPQIAAPEPAMIEPEPQMVEPEPTALGPATEPEQTRRGFFARLFRRRRKETTAETPEPAAEIPEPVADLSESVVTEPALVETAPESSADDVTEVPAPGDTQELQAGATEEPPDLAAELAAMEQAMVEQDTALLTAVLDRLGAAHHRPFSRG